MERDEAVSRRSGVNRTVLLLGLTSFFMDISSEMVAAVIPLYLTVGLGFSARGFGFYAAGYELANAALRIVGGATADRTQRPKETAAAGYGISAATRAGLAGSALVGLPAVPFLFLDRLGKGLRTSPRDALISLSTPSKNWGAAFGVHRTMDAAGALLGPLVAGLILWQVPGSFDSVFVVSFAFGLISVAVITVGVRNPDRVTRRERPKLRGSLIEHWKVPGFRRIAFSAAALGLFTIGDGFLYLIISELAQENDDVGLSDVARWFAYLSAGTALSYLVLAAPLGRLADRIGRARMWVAGHVVLVLTYVAILAHPTSLLPVIGVLVMLGVYYGATDGMLPALAAGVIPEETRSSGISVITTIVAVSRAIAALSFGLIWQAVGADRALLIAAIGLVLMVVCISGMAVLRPQKIETYV